MRILSRLEEAAAEALRRSLRPGWTLYNTPDFQALREACGSETFDVAVLDPLDRALADSGRRDRAANVRFVQRELCLPVVFLTPVDLEAFDVVVEMATGLHVGVMYRFGEDRVEKAVTAIEQAASARLAVRVLRELESAARVPLTGMVAFAIEHLFHRPAAFRRAGKALAELGVSRALMNAELRRAGLASFHVLRRIARVAHAYQLIAAFGAGLKEVVRRVGAGSVDSLNREAKLVTTLPPAQMCSRLSAEHIMRLSVDAACLETADVRRRESRLGDSEHAAA
jgi:hypothetical protein